MYGATTARLTVKNSAGKPVFVSEVSFVDFATELVLDLEPGEFTMESEVMLMDKRSNNFIMNSTAHFSVIPPQSKPLRVRARNNVCLQMDRLTSCLVMTAKTKYQSHLLYPMTIQSNASLCTAYKKYHRVLNRGRVKMKLIQCSMQSIDLEKSGKWHVSRIRVIFGLLTQS